MNTDLLRVALREQAFYIAANTQTNEFNSKYPLRNEVLELVINLKQLGFSCSEELLNRLNTDLDLDTTIVFETFNSICGTDKSWVPMKRNWLKKSPDFRNNPLSLMERFAEKGFFLSSCDCSVPKDTFVLKNYNGCPFCGTAIAVKANVLKNQGSSLKELKVWTDVDVKNYLEQLLMSKVALDATQRDSLTRLLKHLDYPASIKVEMKENAMYLIDALLAAGREAEAQQFFTNPNDILRYLWFKKTGFVQIIAPKTIIDRKEKNELAYGYGTRQREVKIRDAKESLKLKYTRAEGKQVAQWMNEMPLSAEQMCEIMHPKREMWVRMIRALRLTEHAKKKTFKNLAVLLDCFYNQSYDTWAGELDKSKLLYDAATTFKLLKQRPGMFARSLFSTLLWYGDDLTLKHFEEVADKIPSRLLLTLNMYAKSYFKTSYTRAVKPLGGTTKTIGANKFVYMYSEDQLKTIVEKIEQSCLNAFYTKFMFTKEDEQSIYIDKTLFNIPLGIGDRSETVMDLPSALMGTRYPLESHQVRLFMQWGKGLKAQHLDMDLSCKVAYQHKEEICSYSRLQIQGCKHSGDVIQIPNKVGTAEYIEINTAELRANGAKYVSFTCNAYSSGSIAPNVEVGWMNSKYPMKVSNAGVAYDPSCVQHKVRVTQGLNKGLLFGILDVMANEIIWMEMSFGGQVIQNLNTSTVEALLTKLESKMNLGELLQLKAHAQDLTVTESKYDADLVYDQEWGRTSTALSDLLTELDSKCA